MKTLQEHMESSRRSGSIEFYIQERTEDYVISVMPVTPGILNPIGLVQAGALIWLADVTASVLTLGGRIPAANGRGFPLAINIHTVLVGNQKDGQIKAEARFIRKGQQVSVVRTRILGTGEKLLAEVTSTHIPA
jgi:uncharacterized protein (TIGR00369 family)